MPATMLPFNYILPYIINLTFLIIVKKIISISF